MIFFHFANNREHKRFANEFRFIGDFILTNVAVQCFVFFVVQCKYLPMRAQRVAF